MPAGRAGGERDLRLRTRRFHRCQNLQAWPHRDGRRRNPLPRRDRRFAARDTAKTASSARGRNVSPLGGDDVETVNVRVIAATNRNLEELIEQGQFRRDLYERLAQTSITVPPLRERSEDIPLLANHFLKIHGSDLPHDEVYLSPEVENIFKNYAWRGNIRELENVIKRALVLSATGPILPEHLPDYLDSDPQLDETDGQLENQLNKLIRKYIEQNQEVQDGGLYGELIQSVEKQLFEIMLDKHQ